MSRVRNSVLGLLTDVGGTVACTLATLLATPFILHQVSDSLYGFWLTACAIAGYLALTDLGIAVALTRAVAGQAATGDTLALNRLISSAFLAACCAALTYLIIGASLTAFLPQWFRMPAGDFSDARAAYLIMTIAGAAALPLSTFSAIVIGYQRMAFNNTVRTAVSLASLSLGLILVLCGVGIMGLAIAQLLTVSLNGLATCWYARRCFPELSLQLRHVNRSDLRALFGFGGCFQFGNLARTVTAFADPIILASFIGTAAVTPYAVSARLATVFSTTIASKLPTSLFPGVSQLFQARDLRRLSELYIKLTSLSVRLALSGGICVLLVNEQFVSLWVGHERFAGAALTAVFVFWVIQDTIYHGTAVVLLASGHLRGWAIASGAEVVINIAASILGVIWFGPVGVALATSLAKCLTTAWYVPYNTCQQLELSVSAYLWRGIVSPAVRSLPGLGLAILAAYAVPIHLGWMWIVLVAAVAAVGNVLFHEVIDFARQPANSLSERFRLVLAASLRP